MLEAKHADAPRRRRSGPDCDLAQVVALDLGD
jgi:hypothetical protein